ncbi:MAG: MaoC family dehydratase [Minwuiales bacterium]|nr:MaoC family dehydratase [Minwuiales bacterium]
MSTDTSERHGHYLEDLSVGMTAVYSRTITEADIAMFAGASGDTNPIHFDEEFAQSSPFKGRIAHGMLTASFLSTVFGTKLPGPGCIYLSQTLKFTAPVRAGETVVARVEIDDIDTEKKRVHFVCTCTVGETVVVKGDATIMVPRKADQRSVAA